jgi:metal-responsive CopG/Arc/MetJ family transcriptional regulator
MKKRLMRSQMITLRLPRELLKGLDMIALEQEKYRSELVIEAIRQYLRQDQALKSSKRTPSKDTQE